MEKPKVYEKIFEKLKNNDINISKKCFLKIVEITELDGEPEMHELYTDIYIVLEGKGWVYLGNDLENKYEVSKGEYRGSKIRNAKITEITKDTIVIIPPNTAHKLCVNEHLKQIVIKLKLK